MLNASIPQASGDWANTKATYNFGKSERIEAGEIIEAHQKQVSKRASKEEIVLAIQDTSDFNFTHHKAKTESQGFGLTCAQKYVRGLKVHFKKAMIRRSPKKSGASNYAM
jgi:hypothetical protein